ncbi:MAG TPA: prepilin-type N-terminal cleavage/methylation domain-containing protein [Candidatus Krumholzibacteria bacterium]|nr:prepilin-type N-terminal cleavage/methylation domain-containing protein [Candidatus Krumholzibacteria bacterium]
MAAVARRPARGGFTIVEMVIALMIALIVVLAMGRLLVVNQNAWNDGRDKAQLQQNLSEVLDRMVRSVRGARTVAVVDAGEFRTYDAAGGLVHTYALVRVGDLPGVLQEDGVALTTRRCAAFTCAANGDNTSLTLAVTLLDDADNEVSRTTRVTIRNRTIEF